MIPEKVATSMPFEKLNSRTVAAFCSCESSRSFRMPATPLSAMPGQAGGHTGEDDATRRARRDGHDLAAEEGRHERPECGAVAERDRDAERDAEVSHGQAEGQAPETPQHAECVRPPQRACGAACSVSQKPGTSAQASARGATIQLNTPPTSQ